MDSSTSVIIPVFNEEPVISEVIEHLQPFFSNIICVDDASRDNSVKEIAKTKATILTHDKNRGQGAALRTGIQYALSNKDAQYFVTFDADGQHDPLDALLLVESLKLCNADIMLGSRFLGTAENIPWLKKVILKLAVAFTNKTTGVQLTDAHNGLRAFNRRFAESLQLKCNGMAHASEFIYRIAEGNFRYGEAPVTIRYTKHSKSKGQSVFNAFNIMKELRAYRSTIR